MFFIREFPEFTEPIYVWLLQNRDAIRQGTASFDGMNVDEGTVFRQYELTVSLLFCTFNITTAHMLPTRRNGYLRFTSWKYGLASFLFGWWALPWGPLFAFSAVVTNLIGGNRRTASSLLAQLEWGYRIPARVDARDNRRQLLTIDESALLEIALRRSVENPETGMGVLIVLTKWADAQCEIKFVYPVSNGREWVDESQGVTLLVRKKDTERVDGKTLHFEEGEFVISP